MPAVFFINLLTPVGHEEVDEFLCKVFVLGESDKLLLLYFCALEGLSASLFYP